MPYSIFYSGHFAIHGTNQVKKLGRPASAGCIRLHPDNAAKLFNLVKSEGLGNMRVVVE
jgi:lipoprotein-anchoring transpeptidase ErfK/SrfK